MTNHELAISFVERFCAGDVKGLMLLLARDLRFRGPFHQFNSRDAYVSCLKDDPPTRSQFHVLSVTENGDHVAVFYEYRKTDETVMIAQLFKCENGEITEMFLVFDGRVIESM